MASKKIGDAYTEISTRNAKFYAGLSKARKRFARFGNFLAKQAKRAAIATGATLATGIGLSIRAAAKQEAAEKNLGAALKAHGDAVDSILPKMKDLASAIQQQTTMGDEAVLSLMAQIRNLGIMPDQMEQATKGAIGLARALNLDSNAAARYTALALQGEFTVLQRYVPALRTATSEAEKQKIVTDLMAQGFKQAQAETDTVAGRFTQLRNNIGDALEQVGFMITGGADLGDILGALNKKTIGLTKRLQQLRETNFTDKLIMFAKLFWVELSTLGRQIVAWGGEVFKPIWKAGDFVFSNITRAVKNLWLIFRDAGRNIIDLWNAVWQKVVNPTQKFEMPQLRTIQDTFKEMVTVKEFPEFERSFAKLQQRLSEITEQATKKRESIVQDFNKAVVRSIEKRAEKEKQVISDEIAAVEDAEEKKRNARAKTAGQFIGFTEAIRLAQKKIFRTVQPERQKEKETATQRFRREFEAGTLTGTPDFERILKNIDKKEETATQFLKTIAFNTSERAIFV